jgi:predicted Zn finger-like uncharacterized protein
MKFTCDNCQAKYQIGDEKVAGKTVRMKCRRCGYEIRVRAEASSDPASTEMPVHEMEGPVSFAPASTFNELPAVPPHAPPPHLVPPRPAGVPIGAMAPRPGAPPRPAAPAPHAGPAAAAHAHAVAAAAAHAPPPPAPRPFAPPPRAVTSAPAPRPVAASARPGAAPAPARPVTRQSSSTMQAVQPEEAAHAKGRSTWAEDDESTSIMQGQLRLAQLTGAPAHEPEGPDHGWYVGIRGTPTGPIHRAEIRERVAAGDIDSESLVWREGMAEWKPARTFPDLLAVIEAARAPAPAASAVITPGPAPAVPPPAASAPFLLSPQPRAHTPEPHAAAPAPAPAPVAHEAPALEPAPAAVAPVAVLADPFGGPGKAVPADAPVEAPKAAATPVEAPKPAAKAEPEPDLDAVLGRKRGTHPMAYAFIAAAAVFGGVAAWVLLSRPATQIVVVQAPAQATTQQAAAASATADAEKVQVDVGEIATGAPQGGPPKLGGPLKPKATASAAPAAGTPAPIDTSGFVNNVPGPSAQGPSGSQGGGGGQLSQGEISAVVSQNQPLVKRKCWQPALEARAANAPTTARVSGSLTIGASGAVESASASGAERDYPGLSSCIAARMKGWKFPPSGSSTTVNVPFVFAGQ